MLSQNKENKEKKVKSKPSSSPKPKQEPFYDLSLSWDGEADCDISALQLGQNLSLLDGEKHNIVYYEDGFQSSLDNSIKKGSDHRDGDEEGFDEQLRIYPTRANSKVKRVIILASIYKGYTFKDVPKSVLTIADSNGNQLKSYDFQSEKKAIAVGYFEITDKKWTFKKLNKGFKDLETAIMHYADGIKGE